MAAAAPRPGGGGGGALFHVVLHTTSRTHWVIVFDFRVRDWVARCDSVNINILFRCQKQR